VAAAAPWLGECVLGARESVCGALALPNSPALALGAGGEPEFVDCASTGCVVFSPEWG